MSNNPLSNITAEALRKAADLQDEIASLQAQLDAILSGEETSPTTGSGRKKRGRPAGRPKGAKSKGARKNASKKKAAKKKAAKKRRFSKEAIEAIKAGQRRRREREARERRG